MATFALMIRLLGIAIFMTIAPLIWGQSSGNPFDLKFRPSNPTPKPVLKPADINSDSNALIASPKTENTFDASIPTDSVKAEDAVLKHDTITAGAEENPFEVKDDQKAVTPLVVKPDPDPVDQTKEVLPTVTKSSSSKGFQIFFVLLSLLLLIFIVNVERSFVRDLWRVISNENYSSLHHRNQRNTMRQILLMMGYIVFILQAGIFLFHALHIYHYEGTVLDNIWATTGLVLVVYLIRHGVIIYLRWLFNNEKEMTLFGFDISIFNIMVGLVLLPVNILLLFGPESIFKPLIIIGVICIGLAYFLRQLRWMLSARQLIGHSLFLFFVYLCTVEILPLWAISKIFW